MCSINEIESKSNMFDTLMRQIHALGKLKIKLVYKNGDFQIKKFDFGSWGFRDYGRDAIALTSYVKTYRVYKTKDIKSISILNKLTCAHETCCHETCCSEIRSLIENKELPVIYTIFGSETKCKLIKFVVRVQ